MRNRVHYFAGIMVLFSVFSACTEAGNSLSEEVSINQTITQKSEWRVSYFWDNEKDHTHEFQSYTFEFDVDGTLKVFNYGELDFLGSWRVDESSQKLILNMGTIKPLSDLEDDWLIIENTPNKIILMDDNKEHNEILYLEIFE